VFGRAVQDEQDQEYIGLARDVQAQDHHQGQSEGAYSKGVKTD
jgi:hypothetical protein